MNPFFKNFPISSFDVAEIQAVCGGEVACQCGDTISSSRVLNSSDNLTSCTNILGVLFMSASNIEIDCNGVVISTNGTAMRGFIPSSSGLINFTIKNCNFYNFTNISLNFAGTGNDSLIINNNFSEYSTSSGSIAAIHLQNISNVVIRDNFFNSSSTLAGPISFNSGVNVSIINNTFARGITGIIISSSLANSIVNSSLEDNIYISTVTGVSLGAMTYDNLTFRNDRINGSNFSYVTNTRDGNSSIRFINTSFGFQIYRLKTDYTGVTINPNLSSGIYLLTKGNNSGNVAFTRLVQSWTLTNISFTENFSSFLRINYSIITPNTVGGMSVYINGVLNTTKNFNSQGSASEWFGSPTGVVQNFTILIDASAPNLTLVSGNGTYAAGTTSVIFNVTTDENASCRYDTTNASFASLANVFGSTTNQSHSSTLTVLAGSYTYYYACQDIFQINSSSYETSFTVTAASSTGTSVSSSGTSEGRSSSSASETDEETDTNNSAALNPELDIKENILVDSLPDTEGEKEEEDGGSKYYINKKILFFVSTLILFGACFYLTFYFWTRHRK